MVHLNRIVHCLTPLYIIRSVFGNILLQHIPWFLSKSSKWMNGWNRYIFCYFYLLNISRKYVKVKRQSTKISLIKKSPVIRIQISFCLHCALLSIIQTSVLKTGLICAFFLTLHHDSVFTLIIMVFLSDDLCLRKRRNEQSSVRLFLHI